MSNWSVLPLLPFRYADESKNRELLSKVREICGTETYAAYLLELSDYRMIFQSEGFERSYSVLVEDRARVLAAAQRIGQTREEGKIFGDIVQNIFEASTGRKVHYNLPAFKLFLSLMRRKDNEVKWLTTRKAQPRKRSSSKREYHQHSLFR